ncbi:MAG: trypsin-like serine peptidase, partial [Chitinophagales bacterium]
AKSIYLNNKGLTSKLFIADTILSSSLVVFNGEVDNRNIVAQSIDFEIGINKFTPIKIYDSGNVLHRFVIRFDNETTTSLRFEEIYLNQQQRITVYSLDSSSVYSYNIQDIGKNNKLVTGPIKTKNLVIDFLTSSDKQLFPFKITKLYYYKNSESGNGFGTSQVCMVNSICPEASPFYLENSATCKIVVNTPNYIGYCTGTLVNNTKEDGTPYILTANHCMGKSSLNDLGDWEFHFLYHSSTCRNPLVEPIPLVFKGAELIAQSGSEGGEKSSDFLLLKLKNPLSGGFAFTFLGWDRIDSLPKNGICFHHPDGDIKKMSTYSFTNISSFKGIVPSTHFSLEWNEMLSGNSVTQGGSSGAGLLNENKLLVGTLTGGGSYCNPQVMGPDYFGRLSYHWDKFGKKDSERLDVWLDPLTNGKALRLRTIKKQMSSSIEENKKQTEFATLYFDGNYLVSRSSIEKCYIEIYNIQGSKLTEKKYIENEIVVNLREYSKG